MKQISLHSLLPLKNGEFLNASRHVIAWYEEQGPDQLLLKDRLDKLKTGAAILDEVFQQQNQRKLSPEIKAGQKARLNLWRSLQKVLQSLVLREVVSPEASARDLLENFNFHNTAKSNGSVPQHTEIINALLKDWTLNPTLSAAVEANQLQKWVEDLTKINKQVDDLYGKRFAQRLKPADIKTKRLEMKAIMEDLIDDTVAHTRLSNNPGPYQIILDRIQYMLNNYRTMSKIRAIDRKSATKDVGPPEPSVNVGFI